MDQNTIKKINNRIKSLILESRLFFKRLSAGFFSVFFSRDFFGNRIVFWLIILTLSANIANWIILFFFIHPVEGGIILHYNVYFGVDAIGDWSRVFFMPVIGLIIMGINIFLAAFFYDIKERIASHVLIIASFMVQLCLIIASISVIVINY